MTTLESLCPNCMSQISASGSCNTCRGCSYPQFTSIALPAKTVLNDRFWIGRVLGRPGGFGVTYLAWDSVLETTTAIKEYLPLQSVSRDNVGFSVLPNSEQDREFFQEGLRIFLREAKTLAQFSHPNIVRIRDYFTANNTAYLVMDYHQGIALDQYIESRDGKLSEDEALELLLPILDGLEFVHKQRFLHRDVKPQNIYLTEQGIPILLDFGAARYAMAEKSSTLTVMLTAGFAPFEQYLEKGKQGPWSDVYSCGATLYYMVTGNKPVDALERKHSDSLIPPIKLNPAISESFNTAILKAMAVDYAARPANIGVFKNLLLGSTFFHIDATEVIDNTANGSTARSSAMQRPAKAGSTFQHPNRSVVIHYETEKKGVPLIRIMILALATIVLYLYWNGRNLEAPEDDAPRAQTVPAEIVMEAMPIEQAKSAAEAPAIAVPHEPEREQEEPKPAFESAPETAGDERLPPWLLRPANRPPMPPESAFSACRGKSKNTVCRLNTPFGIENGRCVPFDLGRFACIPSGRPPPLRRPPHTNVRGKWPGLALSR